MNKYKKIFLDGVIFSNPTFVLVLGTCPTLGLISSAMSAMSMGLCIIVILTLSNVLISAMRKVIPNEVRIPCYIVLIATLVTLLRMVLEKFLPDIYSALGGMHGANGRRKRQDAHSKRAAAPPQRRHNLWEL